MAQVKVREREDLENAIRRFTKHCIKEGIIADYKRHQRFRPKRERKNKPAKR